MALSENIDYVFVPKVWYLTEDGMLLGTLANLYFIPTKVREWQGQHRQIDIGYEVDGNRVQDMLPLILNVPELTLNQLHTEMDRWHQNIPEMKVLDMEEPVRFKVRASLLGSSITYKLPSDLGWTMFCHKLGKARHAVKAFYQSQEK